MFYPRRVDIWFAISRIVVVIIFLQLLLYSNVFAQPITIIVTGEYSMGQFETIAIAKERAVLNGMRVATEQAGVYVKSYSEIQNLQLSTDEVISLAAAILEVKEKKFEQRFIDTGDLYITVTITCCVSPESIETLRNRVQLLDDYLRVQKENTRLQNEFEDLKVQLAEARDETKKQNLRETISDSNKLFEALRWYNAGNEHQKNNDLDEAIDDYTKSIALNVNSPQAYNNRGLMYLRKKRYDQAIADLNQALVLDPLFIYGYNNRGLAYDYKGLFDQAIINYNQSIAINPQHATAYYNRGVANSHKGRIDQAIADYTQAIAINPRYFDAYYNRGVSHYIKGLSDSAIADYTQAILIDPAQSVEAYNNRGRIYNAKGMFDEAIADFDNSLALNPAKINTYFNKGFACERAGRRQEAITAYRNFIQYATPEFGRYIQYVQNRLTILENMH